MGTFTIQSGETEKLADTTKQDASRFRAFVENNAGSRARLKFADRRKNANTGTEILGGEQVQFELEEGDALFAFNPTTNPVQVNVNPQGLALIDRSTVIQNASIRTDEVGLAKESTLSDIEQNTSEIELDTSDIDLNTDDVENILGNIDSQTDDVATDTTLSNVETTLNSVETTVGNIDTQTDDVATDTTLSNVETTLNSIETTAGNIDSQTDDVLTQTRFNDTVTANNHLAADLQVDSVGLFKTADFTESRNVRELQNQTGVVSGQNTGGGTLASNAVPDGRTVRVQALSGNGSTVQVDGSFELAAGQAVDLAVDNTDKISYTANAGDGVCFIVES